MAPISLAHAKSFRQKSYYVLDFNVIFLYASYREYVMHNIYTMRRAKQQKSIAAIHDVIPAMEYSA